MKVIGRPRLVEFMQLHNEAQGVLQSWLREVEVATWESVHEIQERYPRVQILSGGIATFSLLGNRYHLKSQINFPTHVLLVVEVSVCGPDPFSSHQSVENGMHSCQPTPFQGGHCEH